MENVKKIVIAIDNDPDAENVALNGLQLALQLKAEIAILSVVDTTILKVERSISSADFVKILKSDYKKLQQKLTKTIFKNHTVSTFLQEGKPYEVILKVADEWYADIIVIGTHGRGGLSHLIMGSVAEKVIRHSKKPVLAIPRRLQ
jgi:nucleotide-binding universal stress UspA family protein